jgi:prevent-host-death family protein
MAQWKVARAKQRFSEVLRAARDEPQEILNRDRLVAAVVDGESYRAFQAWRDHQRKPLAEAFAELRRICAEGRYRLDVGGRRDRRNPLPRVLANTAR